MTEAEKLRELFIQ